MLHNGLRSGKPRRERSMSIREVLGSLGKPVFPRHSGESRNDASFSRLSFAWCVVALALLTAPFGAAWAFIDPPTFSPEQPDAGQAVQMTVRAGGCHTFASPLPGYNFLEVVVEDDIIDVIMTGDDYSSFPAYCNVSPHTLTRTIGGFPEGSYTVRIRIRLISRTPFPTMTIPPNPLPILPPASEAPLVVANTPPVHVPATRMPALIGLLALVAIAVVLVFRKSAQRS